MPPLQPFFELTARHGRPKGPFEDGREHRYEG
jgi:hypothetical protein